jgi:hypothetical protein
LVYTNYGNKKFYQSFPEHKLSVGFPREEFCQFPACFLISKGRHISFRHDNNVIPGGKQSLIEAKKFSGQALDSISFYGVAYLFSYGDSQPFYPLGIAAYYSCKVF